MLSSAAPALAAALRQSRLCLRVCSASSASTSASSGWASYGTDASTSRVKVLDSDQDFKMELQHLADSGKLGVFDFTATWCGPCRHIAPVYDELSTQHTNVNFYKVDIDNQAVLQSVTKEEISAVPTFTFYKGSSKVDSFSGARVDLLKEMLAKHST